MRVLVCALALIAEIAHLAIYCRAHGVVVWHCSPSLDLGSVIFSLSYVSRDLVLGRLVLRDAPVTESKACPY